MAPTDAPRAAEPRAELAVWAAMDLLDCGWVMPDIATALDRSIEWLQAEIDRTLAAEAANASIN